MPATNSSIEFYRPSQSELRLRPLHAKAGDVFHWLNVLGRAPNVRYGKTANWRAWFCECKCGKIITVPDRLLFIGNTKSCGCYNAGLRRNGGLHRKHGQAVAGSWTPEFGAWVSMKQRVRPTKKNRKWYYDRGIIICQGWTEDFEAFYRDLGKKPSTRHSLDRIDNDGNYSCGQCAQCVERGWTMNCRWATPEEQGENSSTARLFTRNGETRCLSAWARRFGIKPSVVWKRMKRGWSFDDALITPSKGSGFTSGGNVIQTPLDVTR